jgi:hypothetical protein
MSRENFYELESKYEQKVVKSLSAEQLERQTRSDVLRILSSAGDLAHKIEQMARLGDGEDTWFKTCQEYSQMYWRSAPEIVRMIGSVKTKNVRAFKRALSLHGALRGFLSAAE